MKRTGIKFEMGSGRYDFDAEIFRFEATDDQGPIPCAMSGEAFEDLFHVKLEPRTADDVFAANEALIFKIAEQKYGRGEVNDRGAITISTRDRLAQ
jgi:hypothetical protein